MNRSTTHNGERTVGRPVLVPAVDRAVGVLNVLKKGRGEYGISELARHLDANKGTIREILVTLERHGLVQRDEDTKKYRLGYALLEYGRAVLRNLDHRQIMRPHINRLMELTLETVHVAVLDGNSVVFIDRAVPDADLRISAPIGRRIPAVAGSVGKLLLAYVEDDELEVILASKGLIRFTGRSIVDKETYKSALQQVREAGYSFDDEEYIEGVRGVSGPIRDHRGKVLEALTVVGSSTRMSDDRIPEITRLVVETADEISAKLGAPVSNRGI